MHDHSGHSHDSTVGNNIGSLFAWGVGLNVAFASIEIAFGLLSHSVALVADATHNFSDVLGLLLAWGALVLAKKIPKGRYTYGYRSATILSVLASTTLLFVAVGGIAWSAIGRLAHPAPITGVTMMIVATVGILVNGLSAWLLSRGNKDLNVKSAFMHLLADAAVSAGVVIAGIIIYFTGWTIVDPIISLVISVVVVWTGWGVLRDAIKLSLNAVPKSIPLEEVQTYLKKLEGVTRIHDLHVWPLSTSETALTGHLVMPNAVCDDAFLHRVGHELKDKFGIGHTTLQIEKGEDDNCHLSSDEVV